MLSAFFANPFQVYVLFGNEVSIYFVINALLVIETELIQANIIQPVTVEAFEMGVERYVRVISYLVIFNCYRRDDSLLDKDFKGIINCCL